MKQKLATNYYIKFFLNIVNILNTINFEIKFKFTVIFSYILDSKQMAGLNKLFMADISNYY